jgi:hypothetical protein
MRMILTVIAVASMPACAFAQSPELPAAQAAVEQILGDPHKQQAYCAALKLSEQIAEEQGRLEAMGDKAPPEETEKTMTLIKSNGEEAQRLWHEVDVDFSEISRATTFAALRDPQTDEPYPGAEKFLQDQQEMNARCHR